MTTNEWTKSIFNRYLATIILLILFAGNYWAISASASEQQKHLSIGQLLGQLESIQAISPSSFWSRRRWRVDGSPCIRCLRMCVFIIRIREIGEIFISANWQPSELWNDSLDVSSLDLSALLSAASDHDDIHIWRPTAPLYICTCTQICQPSRWWHDGP